MVFILLKGEDCGFEEKCSHWAEMGERANRKIMVQPLRAALVEPDVMDLALRPIRDRLGTMPRPSRIQSGSHHLQAWTLTVGLLHITPYHAKC